MNPHSAKHHRILSPARLPVPPLRLFLPIFGSEKSITKLLHVVNKKSPFNIIPPSPSPSPARGEGTVVAVSPGERVRVVAVSPGERVRVVAVSPGERGLLLPSCNGKRVRAQVAQNDSRLIAHGS